MSELNVLLEQYFFISTLLLLFLTIYQLPAVTSYVGKKTLCSCQCIKVTTNIVIKLRSRVLHIRIFIFTLRKLKIKYSSNNDLEDCSLLL
ncbi:hypothetical protein P8610_12655 [Fictibacillus sp. UD]|uniref:hypothetical protein n=1 Tax=Fictibacillus sp. UD TaxID=3038777 RepID=UPI003744FA2D